MLTARPRSSERRPSRRHAERPLNTRLARTTAVLLVLPLLLLLVTLVPPGSLPRPALPPAFDGATASQLATELARDYPEREPGSAGAVGAASWYRDKLALYGLTAEEDRWREDVPGLGERELLNLVTVVPGISERTIVLVAHRDNRLLEAGANDNASGTAALLELARAYARTGTIARRPTPSHTLVFVSSDAGAFGALGAKRFATTSPLATRAMATISLDGLAGRAEPRLEIGATTPRSPAPVLVRTLATRIEEESGARPSMPGWLTQLVNLGLPFGYGEQSPFLAADLSAVRLSTAPDVETRSDTVADALDPATLGRLGRATEAAVASIDDGVRLRSGTETFLYGGERAIRGWAVAGVLLTALVPFTAVVADLLARVRRRRLRLGPPWRAYRQRLAVWLGVGTLAALAAVAGLFPTDVVTAPVPDAPPVESWPGTALVAAGIVVLAAIWLASRIRHGHDAPLTEEEQLTGFTVAFLALAVAALLVAVTNAYGLVFVLPSLYTWLWLPLTERQPGWVADALLGLGLAGPVLGLVVLAEQLDLGLRAPVYAIGLATSGIVPFAACLAFLVWAAAATQIAALVAGRAPRQSST